MGEGKMKRLGSRLGFLLILTLIAANIQAQSVNLLDKPKLDIVANAVISDGTNTYSLTPDFRPAIHSYAVTLADTATYTLELTLADPKANASVTENGSPDTGVGSVYTLQLPSYQNTVTIRVTAGDKKRTAIYTIKVQADWMR
jgi:hypothetical protein